MLTLCYIVERIETCLLLQGVEVGMGDLLSWVLFRRRTNLADFVDRSLESNSWFFSLTSFFLHSQYTESTICTIVEMLF